MGTLSPECSLLLAATSPAELFQAFTALGAICATPPTSLLDARARTDLAYCHAAGWGTQVRWVPGAAVLQRCQHAPAAA